MRLDTLSGNATLKRQLSAQETGRGLSHAYLISGPAGSGKRTLARLIAAAMVCSGAGERPCMSCPGCRKVMSGIHPDVITVGSDGKDISVAQARAVRSDAYIRPNEAERKVYIFENAQTMNASAQNALLKLLEEGPAYAAFLLLSDNPGMLLPTIRSRCERLTLAPVTVSETEEHLLRQFPALAADQIRAAAHQCGGLIGRGMELLEKNWDDAPIQEAAGKLLELLVQGNEIELAAWCVTLEKWDREQLSQLMDQSVVFLRDALAFQAGAAPENIQPPVRQAAGLSRKVLFSFVKILEELHRGTAFYVGAGHLCGALSAGLAQVMVQ